MVKNYQLISFVLLAVTILGSINFAAGQIDIIFGKFPNIFLIGGRCTRKCKANEEKRIDIDCGYGWKFCFKPYLSYWEDAGLNKTWNDFTKLFTNDDDNSNNNDNNNNNDDDKNNSNTSPNCLQTLNEGYTRPMDQTTCRKTCEAGEEEIKKSSVTCNSGLICCEVSEISIWKSMVGGR